MSRGSSSMGHIVAAVVVIAILLIAGTIMSRTSFYNVTIEGDMLIFKSRVKEKRFVIEEIEKVDIMVTMNQTFQVDIVVASFYGVRLLRKNLAVLKELILLCKKSNVTAEELDTLISKSPWSLD